MGFFLAGFVRDPTPAADVEAQFLRDERGHLVRDVMGVPVRVGEERVDEEEEWNGFSEGEANEDDAGTSQDHVDAPTEVGDDGKRRVGKRRRKTKPSERS
jgi:putative methyltransferase